MTGPAHNPREAAEHPNLAVVCDAGDLVASGFRNGDTALVADGFWHYFNPQRPDR